MYEPNHIYNVDSYQAIKNIPDKSVDLIYTDIPYLYQETKSLERKSKTAKDIIKKAKELADISNGIDYSILDEFCRICKRIYIYVWCSKMQLLDIMNYFTAKGCFIDLLVWCKTNPQPSMHNVWLPDVEYCLCIREKGCKLNDGYELKSKFYVSGINQYDKKLFNHPTIKPLDLVARHILHSTQPGDLVFDPFIGSGTTAVACKEHNRKYLGFEINPDYYKIAVDRVNGITATGQTSIFTFLEN